MQTAREMTNRRLLAVLAVPALFGLWCFAPGVLRALTMIPLYVLGIWFDVPDYP